jgi:hypothetical protein
VTDAHRTSDNRLLPCPFCGDVPRLAQADNDSDWWLVDCLSKKCTVVPNLEARGRDEAIQKWNTRAPIAAGYERLRQDVEDICQLPRMPPAMRARLRHATAGVDWRKVRERS